MIPADNNIYTPTFKDVETASERIKPFIHRTPVMTCRGLNEITGAEIFFKCENFQKTGAFKFRGATNAVFSLSDAEAARGVATHSSGNHAQALSLAAYNRGIPAHIVVPENTPKVKVDAINGYGGNITFCESSLKGREETIEKVLDKTGAVFISPYNDWRVVAGQGTCGMEFFDQVEELDIAITPVGGGGLLSGTALAASHLSPKTKVMAGEPEGADDAYRSFKSGKFVPSVNPKTVAEGLLTSLGEISFEIIMKHVNDIVTVSDKNIIAAMKMIWEKMKIVAEPSGVVPFGAMLQHRRKFDKRKVGVIISGGNVDLDHLPW
jgi:threonine dehydratase